ncbi:ATP-binding protein [Campylobacter sp. RM9344]|uniref:ATP-binding protein n=1 Tax=Campylobacter californiensis TaxID=1032243 RepID=A0AAW3ZR18_9BACT|nr:MULTISPECIES: ATP-binding protein [unclassified Campylobacter]MBE2985153.1 ATP-binding protein [Campylobacter sp. RM6883]MBE2995743.1 ATP-binding protein [Campylobacter sp. RM6913]MBE3029687.1 ATP-binding protein [Campylobacter sp. RM9344]MBE3607172.1 ATP-binding protein [Campylobacter sp. RM9337]MBE3609528.1 ATP-binding protein [Campylobacter sp. RM12916]
MKSFDTKVTFQSIKNDFKPSDSAIIEAVANAIDAKSKNVYVKLYEDTDNSGMFPYNYYSIDVADDGIGIPTSDNVFEEVFCQYKVSTKHDKVNYGKRGRGRYTYLKITKDPSDISIFVVKDGQKSKISFECKDRQSVAILKDDFNSQIDTKIKKNFTTLIQFKNISTDYFETNEQSCNAYVEYIKNELVSYFADRIASNSINIYVNDELLEIKNFIEKQMHETVTVLNDDLKYSFNVDFYIWNDRVSLKSDRQKHILFLDVNGSLKGIAPSGKSKLMFPGFKQNHSIIVKSQYFNDRDYIDCQDDYDNVFTDIVIKNLRNQIAVRLESILFGIYKDNIGKISKEYLKFLELRKDEIVENTYQAIIFPFLEKLGNKKISEDAKQIIVRLIDVLLKQSPDNYIDNIMTVLNLKPKDSDKLRYIEANYGIIKAISEKEKYIARLDFLEKLSELVNGKNSKKVKERTMLHHVVDKHLWIFGELFDGIDRDKYASDVSLKTILESDKFFQFDSDELDLISREHNLKKIPDIFIPVFANDTIYIIELKKPGVTIDQKILQEIMNKYVKTLKEISKRYDNQTRKRIYAIAVSDTKAPSAYTVGNIDNDGFMIIPKSWDEIIYDAKKRCNEKISDINNKIKTSKWKDLESFILEHNQ